jgi:hypothetical protein
MKHRDVHVKGTEFSVGKNTIIRRVCFDGKDVQWRMHARKPTIVQLRVPIEGTAVVHYDKLVPVEVAAYYPLPTRGLA